jgi:excisionase family DNA binding protein
MSHDEADSRPTQLYRLDQCALWDARDVARFLRVSRSWVYQQAKAGQLPGVKVGGLLRFEPEVIKRLVWSRPV